MSINTEHINKKLKVDTANQLSSLNDYPERFRNCFQDALNFKLLIFDELALTDSELGFFVVPFLQYNPSVRSLSINGNQIGDEGAKTLAQNKTLAALYASDNQIGDEGAKALAQNQTLTTLDVSDNQIEDEGAKALAQNQTLTTLDVSNNLIGDEGVKALSSNQVLTILNVYGNQIGDEGRKALQTVLERRQKEYEQQKIAFAMGTHPRLGETSPILLFSKYCDGNLMREIFSYVKPRPFTFYE